MKKRAPTSQELVTAFKLAYDGRAGKLVEIIKRFSKDDLVAGLSHARGGLERGLSFAAGRKEYRESASAQLREFRKARRQAVP